MYVRADWSILGMITDMRGDARKCIRFWNMIEMP